MLNAQPHGHLLVLLADQTQELILLQPRFGLVPDGLADEVMVDTEGGTALLGPTQSLPDAITGPVLVLTEADIMIVGPFAEEVTSVARVEAFAIDQPKLGSQSHHFRTAKLARHVVHIPKRE
jgi:hypothetical protein